MTSRLAGVQQRVASIVAALLLAAGPAFAGSRVIVSATLNSTLQFFDAESFAELQPPLPSRGLAPVRLWVQRFGDKSYLFAANHGAVIGSVGAFDLSAALVTELPLSPFPARAGSVGVVAGNATIGSEVVPVVLVTNTYFALGGCGLPNGSVTAYDASLLSTAGLLQETGTVDVSGAIPYAVSLDEGDGLAFVSTNCGNSLDTITFGAGPLAGAAAPLAPRFAISNTATREVGSGPDATLFDQARGRSYTNDIGGDSITVYDAHGAQPLTVVPLANAGPIRSNLADSPSGHAWIVTSNGSDDSVSLVDRDVIESCITAAEAVCPRAEVLRVKTKVSGGAPEGVDYDPATNRIFTVNKTIGSPSLSVIQLTEATGGALAGEDIHQIPITAVGASVPIPALIAFDVVVQHL